MNNCIENPYTYSEIQDMFSKQRDKVPFDVRKNVTINNGEKWCFRIEGYSIKDNFLNVMDIWKDDYILSFNADKKSGEGRGYCTNRFASFEEFKAEIFKCFNLEEQQQISMFD